MHSLNLHAIQWGFAEWVLFSPNGLCLATWRVLPNALCFHNSQRTFEAKFCLSKLFYNFEFWAHAECALCGDGDGSGDTDGHGGGDTDGEVESKWV